MRKKRVVILGGGFAGINAAKALGNENFDVLIIDKTNHHLFQPLLYQVASASLSPGDIAVPIREILSSYSNITVFMGEVISIDKNGKEVALKSGDKIDYDFLVVALGARHSYFGNDAWEPFAPGLKTLTDALKVREQILLSFEKAERCDRISEAQKYLNFVIIGGGPTGVEMAGAIAEIAHRTMLKDFRRIDVAKTRIYLVEAAPFLVSAYPESLSKKAQKYLEALGVEVLANKKVTKVSSDGVMVEETFIPSTNVIWAAGNQASKVLKTLDTPLDKHGRVIVEPTLSIPNHPEVFVLGDSACVMGKNQKPLPGLAPVAMQQGRYVAKKIKGKTQKPFVYFDKGSIATIGLGKAVGELRALRISGLLAWLAWSFIHIFYLIGFRNRLLVLMQWLFSFISSQKGARLINRPIDETKPS